MAGETTSHLPGGTMSPAVRNEAYFEEPERRKPPITVVGPVAWVRANLFGSTLDTILTVLGAAFVIFVVVTLLQWSIGAANWYTVIFNLRLFMVGRVEPFMDARLATLALYLALAVGVNLAAWSVVRVRVWLVLVVGLIALFLIPTLIEASIPLPPTYLGAGQREVTTGSITVAPQSRVAFIGGAGEEITITLAEFSSEGELARLSSFTDVMTNTLRNAARNRLAAQRRLGGIQEALAGNRLTDRQRGELEAELEKSEIPPAILNSYQVSALPVSVTVRAGWNGEELASAVIGAGDELRYALPQDGWYVLEKSIPASDESIATLATRGIYPIFDRTFIRDDGKRAYQYVRATDRFLIEGGRPREENGTDTPMLGIIEHQYKGLRGPANYLRVMLAPFLQQVNGALALLTALVAAGYYSSFGLILRGERFVRTVRRAAVWLWLYLPPLSLLLIVGGGDSVVIVAGVLVAVGGLLAVWRIWERLRMAALPPLRRALAGLALLLAYIGLIVLAAWLARALLAPLTRSEGLLQASDPQLWGGFLLTMMLTVVGIVAAFPIGIAMALGRRSSLPVIRLVSTLYIELIRGVPLITLLFMSVLLVSFVVPSLGGPDSAPYKVMVAVTLFSSAYLAENVRGGLQGLPPGQEEAGKAVGLPGWRITLHITLPQALRAVIPAMVGQFISLFKDTSLVAVVGLIDITGVANVIAAQTEFQGLRREAYLFIFIVYFIFSFAMSLVSRRIETSGAGAARR